MSNRALNSQTYTDTRYTNPLTGDIISTDNQTLSTAQVGLATKVKFGSLDPYHKYDHQSGPFSLLAICISFQFYAKFHLVKPFVKVQSSSFLQVLLLR